MDSKERDKREKDNLSERGKKLYRRGRTKKDKKIEEEIKGKKIPGNKTSKK